MFFSEQRVCICVLPKNIYPLRAQHWSRRRAYGYEGSDELETRLGCTASIEPMHGGIGGFCMTAAIKFAEPPPLHHPQLIRPLLHFPTPLQKACNAVNVGSWCIEQEGSKKGGWARSIGEDGTDEV